MLCAVTAIGLALLTATAAPRPTQAEAERRWADYWVEVGLVSAGKPFGKSHLLGRSFVPDKADGSFAVWLVQGEAVLSSYAGSLKVDVTTTPMRVDLVDDGRHVPGIFRFVGDALVWVTPREFGVPFTLGSKPLTRPTDFTSTPENGQVVRVLRRTTGLYGIDLVAPKNKAR